MEPSQSVSLKCLLCQSEFTGWKKSVGERGRCGYQVKCTGLKLHLRAGSLLGPCRQFCMDRQISMDDFTSSMLPPDISESPSQCENTSQPHADSDTSLDSKRVNSAPGKSTCVTTTLASSDKFSSVTLDNVATQVTATDVATSFAMTVPNNLDLDNFLFHQKRLPCIPVSAKQVPSYMCQSSPPPLETAAAIEDEDSAENQESVRSSSSQGSHNTLEDESYLFDGADDGQLDNLDEDELLNLQLENAQAHLLFANDPPPPIGVAGPADRSHWMVAKKLADDESLRQAAPPTPQLLSETSLLKLLIKHKAPLAMCDSVHAWALKSSSPGHDFTRRPRARTKVLSDLENRFNFQSSRFHPTVISYLPDERPTVVYMSSFADAVYSLLTDTELTTESNLSFPDPLSPFLAEPADPALRTNEVSEFHHGAFYKRTHPERCTGPIDVLAPVMFYADGVHTDAKGKLGLTPLNMTLGMFNAATRTKKEAWVTLHFHPDDEAEAAHHKQKTEAFHKVQNLHRGLHAAFEEFRAIADAGGLLWDGLPCGGTTHKVNFKFVFAFMVGDTEMHDELCGKISVRANTVGLCRHCNCPTAESVNPDFRRRLFLTARFERALLDKDLCHFKSINHCAIDNAFHYIDCGVNLHSIHLASPGEILHMLQKGMEVRYVEGLAFLLMSKKDDGNADVARRMKDSKRNLDDLGLQHGALLSRSSERDLPRTKFKNSLFSGTKKSAHEQAGVLLDLLVAMLSDRGRQIVLFERTIGNAFLLDQITVCELCLGLEDWMKKPSFQRLDAKKVPKTAGCVMEHVDATLKRGGMGAPLIKNHLFLHLHDHMVNWGPPRQWNSGPNESHHKTEVKAPSLNTQRRTDSFIQQTAGRCTELRLLRRACRNFGVSDAQIEADKPTFQESNSRKTGARYSVGISNNSPSMRWDSRSHIHRASIHPAVLSLVCLVVLPHLPEHGDRGHSVPCFTEHERLNDTEGAPHCIFRAHPCYRSQEDHPKDVWHDWAYFDAGADGVLPGQILCFMDLTSLPPGVQFPHRGYDIHEPGLCAVVRLFQSVPTCGRLAPSGEGVGELVKWGELQEGFFILNCDSITDTACVVPNLPCIPWDKSNLKKKTDRKDVERQQLVDPIGGYFVISGRPHWTEWFNEDVVNRR